MRGDHGRRRVDAPPRGRLFQEDLREDPFWMLVACVLVNRTTWEKAESAHRLLREIGVESLASAEPSSLHDWLRPLGLWQRRANGLVRLAQAWLRERPTRAKDVERLPWCGKYAADSWAIFVEGRTDVSPDDGKLNWYMDNLKGLPHNDRHPKHPR